MIRIKRPKAPSFLIDPLGNWVKESESAKTHYTTPGVKAFDFQYYNDSKLKDELKKVFVKCAYCESNYGAVFDGDVEHFRPKGKVSEKKPQTPGYYWLANDWDNLFLACQHCNQRRKHILHDETILQGYGKLDQFPLTSESRRVSNHSVPLDQEEKARLLINPCKDIPEKHFEYEVKNALIIPLTEKGRVSIKVYVLQRPYLVKERKKKMLKLFKQITLAKHALAEFNKNPQNDAVKALFQIALENVMDFTKQEEDYAGMCRFFVKKFLSENEIV